MEDLPHERENFTYDESGSELQLIDLEQSESTSDLELEDFSSDESWRIKHKNLDASSVLEIKDNDCERESRLLETHNESELQSFIEESTSDLEDFSSNESRYSNCSSVSEISDDEVDLAPNEQEHVFSCASTSTHEWSVALLSIFYKHSLTYSCVTDILKLFAQDLPSPNSLPQSQHFLMKNFVNYDEDTVLHHCCGFCTQLLPPKSSCSQPECQLAGVDDSSFIEVHLDKQLQHLFSGLLYYYNRRNISRSNIYYNTSRQAVSGLQ